MVFAVCIFVAGLVIIFSSSANRMNNSPTQLTPLSPVQVEPPIGIDPEPPTETSPIVPVPTITSKPPITPVPTATPPAPTPKPVEFHDPTVESEIRRQLETETGDIFPLDLSSIRELRFESGSINSLLDLPALPNLTILELSNQQISDPLPLGQLENLEELYVSDCALSDASPIGDLANLTRLDISNNSSLADIGFASNLEQLKYLNISDTGISDLMPLSNLDEGCILVARNTLVTDWAPVDHLSTVPDGKVQPSEATIPVTRVSLNISNLSLEVGNGRSLSATVYPSNATNKVLSWRSSSSSVARVDSRGYVSAVSPGNTTITVSCGGKSANCRVTVLSPTTPPTITPPPIITPPDPTPEPTPDPNISVTSVALSKKSLQMKPDESQTLSATVQPDNATNKTLTWSSSNTSVARVSNGTVTAIGPGTATITVSCGGYRDTCSVTVN